MKNQKGFTLVELMIVVAIIGILAAIAIPQFAQYRIRGYNASALSDVRNINTSESALFADWQRYGVTYDIAGTFTPAAFASTATGDAALGGDANGDGLATLDTAGNQRGIPIGLGNGVTAVANTDAAVLAATPTTAFLAAAKHLQGNTTYGVDSSDTNVYQNAALLGCEDPGEALTTPLFVMTTNTAAGNDFQVTAQVDAGWVAK